MIRRLLRAARGFYQRLKLEAFESGIAAFAAFLAASSLLHIGRLTPDPLDKLLPPLLTLILKVVYLAAGIAIAVGLGRHKPRIEAVGLVAINVSILTRAIALIAAAGFRADVSTALFFDAIVLWMCAVRRKQLLGLGLDLTRPE